MPTIDTGLSTLKCYKKDNLAGAESEEACAQGQVCMSTYFVWDPKLVNDPIEKKCVDLQVAQQRHVNNLVNCKRSFEKKELNFVLNILNDFSKLRF